MPPTTPDLLGCQIFWPNKIYTNNLYKKTGSRSITKEITHRRLRWLGHGAGLHQKSLLKMDTTWQKKTQEAKNHLVQNCDSRAGTDEPVMGRGPTGNECNGECSLKPYVP
jgi:hypothetical protein